MLSYEQYCGVVVGIGLILGVASGVSKLLSKRQGKTGQRAYDANKTLSATLGIYILVALLFSGVLSMIDLMNMNNGEAPIEKVESTYKVTEVMHQLNDDNASEIIGYAVKVDKDGVPALLNIGIKETELTCDIKDVDTCELIEKTYREDLVVYYSIYKRKVYRLSDTE